MIPKPGQAFYTIAKISQLTGYSEADLQKYIKMGAFYATFMENIGDYIVKQDDLIRFLKKQERWDIIRKVIGPRVIIADRDRNVVDIVKSELMRSGAIDVRTATTDNEIKRSIEEVIPEVITVPLEAITRKTEPIGSSLLEAKGKRRTTLIMYYKARPELVENREDVVKIKESMQVDGLVSILAGVNPLVVLIKRSLGMK